MIEAILWAEYRRRAIADMVLYARLNRLHFAIAFPRTVRPWAMYGPKVLDPKDFIRITGVS